MLLFGKKYKSKVADSYLVDEGGRFTPKKKGVFRAKSWEDKAKLFEDSDDEAGISLGVRDV